MHHETQPDRTVVGRRNPRRRRHRLRDIGTHCAFPRRHRVPGFAEAIAGGAGLRGFDGVEVAGRWRVNVSRGDDWRVDLSYPKDLEDRIKVRVRGDRLWLGFKSGVPWYEPGLPVSADIVMPELEEVGVRGAAMVEVSGFRGRRLEIDISGAARLEGTRRPLRRTGTVRRGCERHRPARHCGD